MARKRSQIRAVIKYPDEPPKQVIIKNKLEVFQQLVGGYIETLDFADNMTIIVDEEGILKGYDLNAIIFGQHLFGPIIFVGTDGEEFTNIPITWESFQELFKPLFWTKGE